MEIDFGDDGSWTVQEGRASKVFARDVVLKFVGGDMVTYAASEYGQGALDALPTAAIVAALSGETTLPVDVYLAVTDPVGLQRPDADVGRALRDIMVKTLAADSTQEVWARDWAVALRAAVPNLTATEAVLAPVFEVLEDPGVGDVAAHARAVAKKKLELPRVWDDLFPQTALGRAKAGGSKASRHVSRLPSRRRPWQVSTPTVSRVKTTARGLRSVAHARRRLMSRRPMRGVLGM
jgi:hypothetical protein